WVGESRARLIGAGKAARSRRIVCRPVWARGATDSNRYQSIANHTDQCSIAVCGGRGETCLAYPHPWNYATAYVGDRSRRQIASEHSKEHAAGQAIGVGAALSTRARCMQEGMAAFTRVAAALEVEPAAGRPLRKGCQPVPQLALQFLPILYLLLVV